MKNWNKLIPNRHVDQIECDTLIRERFAMKTRIKSYFGSVQFLGYTNIQIGWLYIIVIPWIFQLFTQKIRGRI